MLMGPIVSDCLDMGTCDLKDEGMRGEFVALAHNNACWMATGGWGLVLKSFAYMLQVLMMCPCAGTVRGSAMPAELKATDQEYWSIEM